MESTPRSTQEKPKSWDTKAMLQADDASWRRVITLIERLGPFTQSSQCMLDIGCGEGYYSRQLNAHAGLDISKDGVRMAAKAHPSGQYVWAVPTACPTKESFDTLVCVFSPLDFDEALRVLRPGGRIYWVGPGAGH